MWLNTDAVKQYLVSSDISIDSYDLNFLNTLCSATEKFIENYCNRPIEPVSIIEFFDGGKSEYQLKYFPVINLSLYVDPNCEFDEESKVSSNDYFYTSDGLIVFKYTVCNGKKIVKAVYTAGWTSVPQDLIHAGCMLVVYFYDKVRDKTIDVIGRTGQGYSLTLITRDHDIPPTVKSILDNYRLLM